jgi:opine dehydrogenase
VAEGTVVVLGGTATGFALAAQLALAGREVVLCDASPRKARIAAIKETRRITLLQDGAAATATLAAVTDDPFAAFAAGDVLLAPVPASEQPEFGRLLLPLVEPRHVMVLMPGGLASLDFAHWLLARGRWIDNFATFAETDLAPIVCRKDGDDAVRVFGSASRLGLGVFPASRTAATLSLLGPLLEPLVGEIVACDHAAAAGLGAVGALLRTITVLMNAGRIERTRGDFLLYDDGFTPAVASAVEAVDAERRAVCAALGCESRPIAQILSSAGYGPEGDLWTTVHGSRAFSQVTAPRSLRGGWSSDVSHVLRTWAELGERLEVPVPGLRAVIRLADAATGQDSWGAGRSLDDLGVARMSRATLVQYLGTGETD